MNYLLDTCAVSELIRAEPDRAFLEWLDSCDEQRLAVSVLTFGEIEKGIAKLPDSDRRDSLREWLHHDLVERFSGRVLGVTPDIAFAWGRLLGEAETRGAKLPVIDALIAATAIVHECAVVTRNQTDLERCGAPVLNPWGPAP